MKKLVFILVAAALALSGCNLPVKVNVTVFASPTPTITPSPTPTATVTPSPTPSPTPTPPPAARVEQADLAMFHGDYELARREFQSAYASASDPALRAAAALGMGRALYYQNNTSTAVDALNAMIAEFPDDAQVPIALFYLGKSYDAQDGYADAAQTYARLAETGPAAVLDVVQDLRGDALLADGDLNGAVEAYNAAIEAAPEWESTLWTEMKLAGAYSSLGDDTNAVKTYLAIYEQNDNEYVRAQANLLLGQIYLAMGETDQANARFLDSVNNYPKAYDSYSALVQLVNSGVAVDEMARGMVDYYAGKYGLAIEAFRRYIDSAETVDAQAYYYLALCRLGMSEPGNAIANLDYLIETYPGDRYWSTAWDEKAYIQWAVLEDYEAAAATLMQYVELAPDSSEAPEFLFQAARIQERAGLFVEAAATWERVLNTYPAYENSYRALFLAGVTLYRAADYAKALVVFQRCLVLATEPDEEAAANLWIGKSHQAQGAAEASRAAWEQAAQRDPTGYYSERAKDLLADRAPFTNAQPVDLGYDLTQERPEAEAWLRATFSLPPETDLSGLGELAADPRIQRGEALWRFGLLTEARNEFEEARKAAVRDPVATYRIMNYLYGMGLYRSALLASRQILDLADLDDLGTLKAPAYFNHIRFGVYYKDLVLAAAQNEEINPLLLLSVMRQESLFEGFAISSAGARGLMQIMPATGEEIAANMRWPEEYSSDDLYRPVISIPMGARYLARQRDYFEGSVYTALAAYNGGPGNTMFWNEMANNDPDLLMEVIRAEETRKYIRQIYEFFNLYRLLYERDL